MAYLCNLLFSNFSTWSRGKYKVHAQKENVAFVSRSSGKDNGRI